MEFGELKHRLFYSEAMRALDSKEAPVRGYSGAGWYARRLQRYVESVAVENGLDRDYCGVLALASVIGMPPYGREGQAAIRELLGDAYDRKKISGAKIEDIAKEPVPEQMLKDMESIESRGEDASNEARAVMIVERTLEAVSLLTEEEYEKMGSSIVEIAVLCGAKKDRNGILRPGKSLIELENQYLSRKPKLNEERKRKVLELFQEIIADAATDNERIEKIIGE